MIDLHCHMLPAIDDGAADLEVALEMARIARSDGITVTACTPHIMPGVYGNTGPQIRTAIDAFSSALNEAGIDLKLVTGADVHLATDLVAGLKNGQVLTLNDSRYFLFEPPHHVMPPRLEHAVFDIMTAGYQPILTHPERLTWIEDHYQVMLNLAHAGVWMQITCGSVTGRFGRRPQYWADRMIDEGLVHILATDAHNLRNRSPSMAKSRDMVAERLGEVEANNMVVIRPQGVLDNVEPATLPPPVAGKPPEPEARRGLFAAFGLKRWAQPARRSL
ncbi:MAG TPA: CpsB/CapC family capsule biosynthesis tyrosine phosphatase [Caulobacteraceae bacterium]|nr:CpsB/CapC family capsule biosynthesis tyrosine phosphatase [Caulobacteraceae bacterium]